MVRNPKSDPSAATVDSSSNVSPSDIVQQTTSNSSVISSSPVIDSSSNVSRDNSGVSGSSQQTVRRAPHGRIKIYLPPKMRKDSDVDDDQNTSTMPSTLSSSNQPVYQPQLDGYVERAPRHHPMSLSPSRD